MGLAFQSIPAYFQYCSRVRMFPIVYLQNVTQTLNEEEEKQEEKEEEEEEEEAEEEEEEEEEEEK